MRNPEPLENEYISIEEIYLDPDNAREHPRENIEFIKESLLKYGQPRAILIDVDNVVRAGNGTFMAAREIGWTHINAVRSNLTHEQLVAYGIIDNRSQETSKWNFGKLSENVKYLSKVDKDFVLQDIGFTPTEFQFQNVELEDVRVEKVKTKKAKTLEDHKEDLQPIKSSKKIPTIVDHEDSSDEDEPIPVPKVKLPDNIETVQLIFNQEEFQEFMTYTSHLGKHYGTTNPTTTVMQCLLEKYKEISVEAMEEYV